MTSPSQELLHVASLMREAFHTCILPWFGKLTSEQIGEKGPEDFVTIADTSAEAFLGEHLMKFYPGSRIIGEEGAAADPALLSTMADGACWIIDPVDGTRLFKDGEAHFGTLISRSENGQTQAAWLLETYFGDQEKLSYRIIMGDKSSGVWHAEQENAAFERLPLFADPPSAAKPEGHLLTEDFTPGFLREDLQSRLNKGETTIAWKSDLYSSVSYYSNVLRSVYAVSFSAGDLPWDNTAGAFLVQLLGGVALHIRDDQSYNPDRLGKGVGVAHNQTLYEQGLIDAFNAHATWPKTSPDKRKS